MLGGLTKSLALNHSFKVKTKFIKKIETVNQHYFLTNSTGDGVSFNNYSSLESLY